MLCNFLLCGVLARYLVGTHIQATGYVVHTVVFRTLGVVSPRSVSLTFPPGVFSKYFLFTKSVVLAVVSHTLGVLSSWCFGQALGVISP